MAFSARTRKYLLAFLIIGWSITLAYFIFHSNRRDYPLKTKQLYRDNRLLMSQPNIWKLASGD